jgi:hypothetical protein
MKVVGSFNKVSDRLKKELIPAVKPNEIIFLQLLQGHFEPSIGRVGFGSSRSLRLSDTIFDPYARKNEKGEYEGEYVDIGIPDKIKDGRVESCKKFWVNSVTPGIPGNGEFQLTGGNIDDMLNLEFFCLSNGNANNPYRDKSKEPLYEVVNPKAILEKEKANDKKELENKFRRFAKNNPEEAAEILKTLSPNGKAAVTS